ncbi:MAG: nucleotidyltransferase domain-containing protein [Candidatus Omnitrophica bacterium]|nr:nucleotidyltransferase domain-containing protein [Candidatus Omnitrophota bacterium]
MNIIKIPDIDSVKKILLEWVTRHPRITRIYLFGSYAAGRIGCPSDIDIAIEIEDKEGDTAFGYWCSQGSKLQGQLTELLNYQVDLEWYDAEETPTVKKGLDVGNIVIYEKG